MTYREYEQYRQSWHRSRAMHQARAYLLGARRRAADRVCGRIYEDCC